MYRLLKVTLLFVLAILIIVPLHQLQVEAQSAWAPGVSYSVGALVTYNGSVYKCIQAHTSQVGWEPPNVAALWSRQSGTVPTNTPGSTSPTRTRTSTPGGSNPTPTRPPSGTCSYPAYVHGQVYTGGARVSYNSRHWEAKWWTQNEYPSTGGTGVWADLGACSGGTSPTRTRTPTPGSSNPTATPSGTGFSSIVSQTQFNQMFPNRNSFYTYQGLVTAAAFYPAFAGTGTLETRRREAAAALANFNHETGGLVYIEEINKSVMCSPSAQWPCAAGKMYYGRGPIQLSWNFNYGAAGQALGLGLLNDPDMVARDPAVAWKTALWYWMTQTGPGTMTPHNAMVNGYGFGETIRSINGSLECNGGNPAQVQSRINAYQNFTSILGVTPGSNLSC